MVPVPETFPNGGHYKYNYDISALKTYKPVLLNHLIANSLTPPSFLFDSVCVCLYVSVCM